MLHKILNPDFPHEVTIKLILNRTSKQNTLNTTLKLVSYIAQI